MNVTMEELTAALRTMARVRRVRFRSREDAFRLLGQTEESVLPPPFLPADPRAGRVPVPDLYQIPVVFDPELGPDDIELDTIEEPPAPRSRGEVELS